MKNKFFKSSNLFFASALVLGIVTMNVRAGDSGPNKALHEAIESNNLEGLQVAIDSGANVNPLNAAIADKVIVKIFTGADCSVLEDFISQQRRIVFSQYPYLIHYEDDVEHLYVSTYSNTFGGAIAVAYKNGEIVGFLTGTALVEFDRYLVSLGCSRGVDLLKDIVDVSTNYYIGEVVVLEQYRGQSIVEILSDAMAAYALSLGFNTVSFITIIREKDHPQRPVAYQDYDHVWKRLGCNKTDKVMTCNWPTVQLDGSFKNENNNCAFWLRKLVAC